MNRRTMLCVLPASVALAGLGIAGDASAQGTKRVAGTYEPVSVVTTDASGKKSDVFGPGPRGQLVLTADGRYSLILMRATLPKFASKSRLKGTADENKEVVAGTIAHFGKYTIDDKAGTITFHVDSSTLSELGRRAADPSVHGQGRHLRLQGRRGFRWDRVGGGDLEEGQIGGVSRVTRPSAPLR